MALARRAFGIYDEAEIIVTAKLYWFVIRPHQNAIAPTGFGGELLHCRIYHRRPVAGEHEQHRAAQREGYQELPAD